MGHGKPPQAPGTAAGQLGGNPSLYPGAAAALDGRTSFHGLDQRASMQHMMSVPNDLVKQHKPGMMNLFKSGYAVLCAVAECLPGVPYTALPSLYVSYCLSFY
jgi:hypothetical protein